MRGPEKRTRRSPARLPIALAPEERRTLDEVAREHVRFVLHACHNNRRDAARVLGIDRKTLARNLERWGITLPREATKLRPGSLVAIEGIDGAGISTQARRLVDYLNANGHPAQLTDEPSPGRVGQLIRELLAAPLELEHNGAMRTLSLLFAADRVDHYHRVVAPALQREVTVISDRWYHSSLAYQRTGVERDWIMALNRYCRTPDVTVYLDVRPEVGAERRRTAGRPQEFFHDVAMQRDIVSGYRATIAELQLEGERIEIIDGEPSIEDVSASVRRVLGLS